MYHTQSQPIPEWFTYSDSGAQDEQNEYLLHQVFFNFDDVLIFGALQLVNQHKGPIFKFFRHKFQKRTTYSDSGAQDEQNEYLLHQVFFNFDDVLIFGALQLVNQHKGPIFKFFRHKFQKRTTYSDSGAQDEQNEYLHHQIPSTQFMFIDFRSYHTKGNKLR